MVSPSPIRGRWEYDPYTAILSPAPYDPYSHPSPVRGRWEYGPCGILCATLRVTPSLIPSHSESTSLASWVPPDCGAPSQRRPGRAALRVSSSGFSGRIERKGSANVRMAEPESNESASSTVACGCFSLDQTYFINSNLLHRQLPVDFSFSHTHSDWTQQGDAMRHVSGSLSLALSLRSLSYPARCAGNAALLTSPLSQLPARGVISLCGKRRHLSLRQEASSLSSRYKVARRLFYSRYEALVERISGYRVRYRAAA